ncbi:hypothetical protein KF707_17360 [Candidatus Obscuribacterales bacterium]|nr:hypothetical protein [Candidatus Obscuribacterales bacterium]MBX3152870.1 hypothetical protein [Candidatus Obscuribacterales bacterium]
MLNKNLLSSMLLVAGASLFLVSPATAQESEETNPNGYDKSFIDRPDHKKPTNPFAARAADFPKHSYRRMLLSSPFASSSVGLGVNSSNQMYNQNAYTYLNPDSFKANDATPEEVNRYIDQVYKPDLNKSGNQGYETNKGFDQPNPFTGTRSSLTEENPFGSTFDNGPNSPYMQPEQARKKQYYGQKDISDSQKSVSTPASDVQNKIDTSQSNF